MIRPGSRIQGQATGTGDSPTFGGLTITGLSGVLKATAGVISGSAAKSDIGLGNVENTALSTWAGSANLTTVGALTDVEVAGEAYFSSEIDNGNSGSADTIDWSAGNKQKSTLTDDCVFTFDAEPSGAASLVLKLVQGGSGSYTVTWPADVKWPAGTAPTLSTAVGSVDLISFYYDGADFHGQASLDFQVPA